MWQMQPLECAKINDLAMVKISRVCLWDMPIWAFLVRADVPVLLAVDTAPDILSEANERL